MNRDRPRRIANRSNAGSLVKMSGSARRSFRSTWPVFAKTAAPIKNPRMATMVKRIQIMPRDKPVLMHQPAARLRRKAYPASGRDNRGPKQQRGAAGKSGQPGWLLSVPCLKITHSYPVKQRHVDSGKQQTAHFQPERNVAVVNERLG